MYLSLFKHKQHIKDFLFGFESRFTINLDEKFKRIQTQLVKTLR